MWRDGKALGPGESKIVLDWIPHRGFRISWTGSPDSLSVELGSLVEFHITDSIKPSILDSPTNKNFPKSRFPLSPLHEEKAL